MKSSLRSIRAWLLVPEPIPTTRMCIAMIEKYLKKTGSFLDVGTGSGILMIVAAKLGASKVWGTDNDDIAVDVAWQNLMQNRISETTFKILTIPSCGHGDQSASIWWLPI